MTDEHVKGTLSKARGKVEEGLGKVTGSKQEQVRGKGRQVQGSAQKGLGDVQGAIRKPKNKPLTLDRDLTGVGVRNATPGRAVRR